MSDILHEHPPEQRLLDYGLGKLAPEEACDIESHIAECDQCSETLINLQDDTFVNLVRRSDGVELPAEPLTSPSSRGVTVDGTSETSNSEGELPAALFEHPRYEVLERIGRGGMGDVYKAQHKVMNRQVALKVIKPDLIQHAAAIERFRREVQAAARLHHANIVTAHDAEQAGGLHFLVMEFVDGIDFDEVIRERGPLLVAEACDYIRQAAEGLQHAHKLGMVHRDIKPHNLMLSSSGDVKILDFGLANLASEIAAEELESACDSGVSDDDGKYLSAESVAPRRLTQLGTMMGTPDFNLSCARSNASPWVGRFR